MDAFADAALGFIDRCASHGDMASLMADFSAVLAKFGINHFMMTRLPAKGHDPEPLIIAHTWSVQWLDRYREQAYFWSDPVSHFSLGHHMPFTWEEARQGSRRTRRALQIASEAKSIGMADGLGFPLTDPSSVQSVVSLASDQAIDLPPAARALLHMVCTYCEHHAVHLMRKPQPVRPLTPREREVLQWMANGKSTWETSQILGSSKRTVESQLVSARQKLDATNTIQAIAKALYSRQIIL